MVRHHWFAGGVATVLSTALIFSGVTPAMAEDPTPPPAAVEETTPLVEEDSVEEVVTPVEPPAPVEEAAPVEEPQAEEAPVEEVVVDDTAQARVAAPEADAAPQLIQRLAASVCDFGDFEIDGNLSPGIALLASRTGTPRDWVRPRPTRAAPTARAPKTTPTRSPGPARGTTPTRSTSTSCAASPNLGRPVVHHVGWSRTSTSGSGGYALEVSFAGERVAADGTPQPIRDDGGIVSSSAPRAQTPRISLRYCTYTSQATYTSNCVFGNDSSVSGYAQAISADGFFFEVGLNLTQLAGVAPGCPRR